MYIYLKYKRNDYEKHWVLYEVSESGLRTTNSDRKSLIEDTIGWDELIKRFENGLWHTSGDIKIYSCDIVTREEAMLELL